MDPMMRAFEGEPKTKLENADKDPVISVEASYLSPEDAMGADAMAALAAWGGVLFSIWTMVQERQFTAGPVILFLAAIIGREFLALWLRDRMRRTVSIRFTETEFRMKHRDDWTGYNRRHPHRFVLIAHDKAQAEKDEHDYRRQKASANGAAIRLKRYYSDTSIIVFEYLGQRIDVAEVLGAKNATAILMRLNLCDEFMNGVASNRRQIPLSPAHEWGKITTLS